MPGMSDISRQVVRSGLHGAGLGCLAGAILCCVLAIVIGLGVSVTMADKPEPPGILKMSRWEAALGLGFFAAFPGAFVGAVAGAIYGARSAAVAMSSAKPHAQTPNAPSESN
jgi:hypothetical protein